MESDKRTSASTAAVNPSDLGIDELDREKLPRHVAIIMDGNGRWAQRRGMPRIEGHRRGAKTVRMAVRTAAQLGIEQLTLYCLSRENWKRPASELSFLMVLLEKYLQDELDEIMRQGLRFRTIGQTEQLPKNIQTQLNKTKQLTAEHTGMTLCLALNYGARQEIVEAVQRLAKKVADKELAPEQIDESMLAAHLDTAGMPDPDLVIRTAGELRISNFLLWQISYAELWVTQKHWPEFDEADFLGAMKSFAQRDRRFGGLNS